MKFSENTRRADLGLRQFDLPPAEPVFSPNPVAELVVTDTDVKITLKLRVPSPPSQYTLVQGAAPVRIGVRCVQHFPFLGLLPPPTDGWSDITELYVARYGVPNADTGHLDSHLPAHRRLDRCPKGGPRPRSCRNPIATLAEASQ